MSMPTDSRGWVYPKQTHEEYMAGNFDRDQPGYEGANLQRHFDFYAQFVTEGLKSKIRRHPDTEKLLRPLREKEGWAMNFPGGNSNKWWEDFEIAIGVRAPDGRFKDGQLSAKPGGLRIPWPRKDGKILISDCDIRCVTKEAVRQVLAEKHNTNS